MSSILYITANPNTKSKSYSLQLGEAFICAYEATHPMDRIQRIDLYKQTPPTIDEDVLAAREQLIQGDPFRDLNSVQQQKLFLLNQASDQFIQADKWVFVSPIWNWGVPPIMKQYIDAVMAPDRAYKIGPSGVEGLLKGKKAMIIQTSNVSGVFNQEGDDYSYLYLKSVLNKIGVQDVGDLLFDQFLSDQQEMNVRFEEWIVEVERQAIGF